MNSLDLHLVAAVSVILHQLARFFEKTALNNFAYVHFEYYLFSVVLLIV
jgi:hypothetical protein